MPSNQKNILWGEGVVFADGIELFDAQELSVNFGINNLSAPKGDGGGNINVSSGQPITGRINFLGMNASVLSLLTGGIVATGTTKRIRGEELTVASNAVTTSQTAIVNTLYVVEKGGNKIPLKRLASGSPSAADEFSVSGTTITLNTGTFADGAKILASYFYLDGSNGETVSLAPNSLPDEFELMGSVRAKEAFGGTKGDMIFKAAKCTRTSEFGVGGTNGNITIPGFDFEIRIDNQGDFEAYFQ